MAVHVKSLDDLRKPQALSEMESHHAELSELQERLYAEGKRSLLVVLQGMDTSGKDGTIKHVATGVNPQGVRVTSFKSPTKEELSHHFLWRIRRGLPKPGEIAIFNRSHYEDVLIVRVKGLVPPEELEPRYDEINRFERQTIEGGTTILKFFLDISPGVQGIRLLQRLQNPDKHWKWSDEDIRTRARWADYMDAYRLVIQRCSSAAPWYTVPSDRKWYRNYFVSRVVVDTLRDMNPMYPRPRLDVPRLEALLAAASPDGTSPGKKKAPRAVARGA